MQITVKGKQIDLTDSLKNHANERISKISRYFDHIISAEVCLSIERNWHVAEITVFGEGFDMRGEEKSTDMYNSIDRVIEKLERQLKKKKGKKANRHSARGPSAPPPPVSGSEPGPEKKKKKKASGDDASLYAPRVEHEHSFYAPSLSIEEAIKEMESAGHEFYAFFNEEKRRVNVVYKRKKKGYGLLDPRLED